MQYLILITDLLVGVTAPMASITLVRTVSFSIYQRAKYSYAAWLKRTTGHDVIRHVNKAGNYPNLYSVLTTGAAGATAGSIITFIACPFELAKLSAQVSVLLAERSRGSKGSADIAASYQNKGTLKTMANIVKHRGILGLYTGFRLHLCVFNLLTFKNIFTDKQQCATPLERQYTLWCTKAASR